MNPGARIEVQWEDATLSTERGFSSPEDLIEECKTEIVVQAGFFVAQKPDYMIVAFDMNKGKFRSVLCIPTGMIRSVTPMSPSASLSPMS